MDKSREPENNTTSGFKDKSNQKKKTKKLKTSSDQIKYCCQHSLVCQYTQMRSCVELNLKRHRKTWNNLKIQVILQKGLFRFFSLQPPPPERADKSSDFVLSWGNDWARGQTSKTDENKRLSGGPLKGNCWGGTETFMSCLCGSTGNKYVYVHL